MISEICRRCWIHLPLWVILEWIVAAVGASQAGLLAEKKGSCGDRPQLPLDDLLDQMVTKLVSGLLQEKP